MTVALLALTGEAAQKGGLLTDLGINIPVLLTQVVIFSITFIALSRILFSTVLRRMQEREAELHAAHQAVQKDRAEVARLAKEYEAKLVQVDREAYERAQQVLTDGLAQAQALVARALAQGNAEVQKGVADFARAREEARPKVRAEVSRLALEMAGKALGGPAGSAASQAVDRWLQGRLT
jgi:F-type H+-transporting ATPase subunit b